jgi:hypothetical protein
MAKAIDFDLDDVLPLLNKITDTYKKRKAFIGAICEDDQIEIRFSSLLNVDTSLFPSQDIATRDGRSFSINTRYTEGPEIVAGVSSIKPAPEKLTKKTNAQVMGGDYIENIKAGFGGTIGMFVQKVTFPVNGRKGKKTCITPNALMSNNHVIGRSDKGKKGEILRTKAGTDLASLHCLIPFSIWPDCDYATGVVMNTNNVRFWYIKSIGEINNKFLYPKKNQAIKKSGDATGLTQGTIKGIANIKSGGYWYYGVFVTNVGFGSYGDSGAIVVNANNDVVGMWSWLDHSNGQPTKTYFYCFVIPKRGLRSRETEATIEAWNE